jgi:vancomycin aglycone glucosyltransferase
VRVSVSARGSRGDVYPLIAIAGALRRQGCDVSLCVPPLYAELARAQGIEPLHYGEDAEEMMRSFGTDWRATRAALRWFARDIDEQFRILRRSSEGADALVTSANEVTASTVAEYRRIPHFRVAYAPIIPGSHPPPLQPFQGLPPLCNRLIWGAINASLYPLFGPPLNRLRIRIGLQPTRDLPDLFAARSQTLLAISHVLAPPADGWRYPYRYVGYCFNNDDGPLDAELEAFLAAGPPPVYVGFGSVALGDAGRLTELVLRAVRRAGCRALIGRGWFGLGGQARLADVPSDQVLVVGDTPHATLFPRCAAAIHHGGSGTVHNAARAGVAQLALPQIVDQYYWGHRLAALGVGPAPIRFSRLTVDNLTDALRELRRPSYAARARRLAPLVAEDRGIETAVATIAGERRAQRELVEGLRALRPAVV